MRYAERLYDAFMYPLEAVALAAIRRSIIPRAKGRVLEIGVGTGANLPFYRWDRVSELHLTDVALTTGVTEFCAPGNGSAPPLRFQEARAEALPFDDASFDSVVFTMVFCSVADQPRGLAEVRRVLRPGGRLVFVEHVRPATRTLGFAADLVNPVWHAATGECNVNRDTVAAIPAAGFEYHTLKRSGRGFLAHGCARAV